MLNISLLIVHLDGILKRGHATLIRFLNLSPSTNLIGNSSEAIILAKADLIKSWSNFYVPITPMLVPSSEVETFDAGSKVKSFYLEALSCGFFVQFKIWFLRDEVLCIFKSALSLCHDPNL